MAHETEAAALLRSGNLFPRRVGLRDSSGRITFVGIKHGSFAIYRGDRPYYHFDLEGRWQRAYMGETHFRKALDGSAVALDRVRDGANMVLTRRHLSVNETSALDASIRDDTRELAEGLEAGRFEILAPPSGSQSLEIEALKDVFARVDRWDAAAWFGLRERYFTTYAPIGLLPPDAHTSVVLQATIGQASGHPFGGGPPSAYGVRDPEQFEEHVSAVTTLLGRRLAQARAVFLGGPDAFRRPLDEILPWMEVIRRRLPIDPAAGTVRRSERPEDDVRLAGIDTFLDEFAPPLPDEQGWTHLRSLGLGRVTLGIESGDPKVRALYGRSWGQDELRTLVDHLKAASIPLGILVLIGAGGREHADAHLDATTEFLSPLPLERGDLVFLMDAAEVGDAGLAGRVVQLDPRQVEAQATRLQESLADFRRRTGAKVLRYNPEKQWN